MILADTSVWIEHLRSGNSLGDALISGLILVHPAVAGELACGNLRNRAKILGDLQRLPRAVAAADEEVLRLIDSRKLWGHGIGWIDAHHIASALLTGCRLWTLDRRLRRAASAAGVQMQERG